MERQTIDAAVAQIRRRSAFRPEIALVLGSGLGPLADQVEGEAIPFADIPNFPVSTAPGHEGRLILGRLFGRDCAVMQGRVHLYEGYTPQEVVFPVRVMQALGAETLVLTNAAGGMNPEYRVGDLVVIEDHLSLPVAAGLDPLRGPNDPELGPRFVSMNHAYDPGLVALAERLGGLKRGVYAHVAGPSFEPPALIRMLRAGGCDLVGMSTVPEVIAARHLGMRVLAISAVTNIAVDRVDDPHVTSEAEVWETARAIRPRFLALMEALIPALPRANR
ncbi:Purine nucleoside phosphorylase 1 [Defluviimonas aquaemixtae]|uniref:Purine nucleoside phosphorylase n=1 Tax=Albidovulum aquaemixtae TaxID=1542388 RepID=A0A2R8BIU3_9RHOB|nr:purine-nucleoside phosphorylase [Defluviimonas aquaemixtae]SPH23325.1 Purine nucleoside phosphorylase 1 [Defluviimonas aquaemixtae]